jgi:hypothetical protein
MQFRRLPPFGGDPRAVAEILNNAMDGKTNNTGLVTLENGSSTSTVLYDDRISVDTKIVLIPFSASAFQDTVPYGEFLCTSGQTAASPDTEYAIGYNTTEYGFGVTLSNTSRLNMANAGTYQIGLMIQFENQANENHDVDVWFKKNGNVIANSNHIFTVPARKSASIFGKLVATIAFMQDFDAGEYLEAFWSTPSTDVIIKTKAADTSPTRPVTPCVTATVNYVGASASTNVFVSSQSKGQATISHFANSATAKTYAYILVG